MSTERDAELRMLYRRAAADEWGRRGRPVLGAALTMELADFGLRAVAEAAWDEACMALGWAIDNGPVESAAAYVASTNPYRSSVTVDKETKK